MEKKNILKDLNSGQKNFDWQSVLIKYLPLLIIFIASLLFNLIFFSWGKAPVHFNDSVSYINVAESIRHFHLPDLSIRTPVYPLYLSFFLLFNKLNWAVLFQIVIGAFSAILLYLIILKLIKIRPLALILALFLVLDFGVSNFQSAILSETLALFLLLVFVYLRIVSLNREVTKSFLILLILADIFLFFVKPNFIILPICLYILQILMCIFFLSKTSFYKKNIIYLSIGILINIVIIVGYSGLNLARYGFFSFTSVSDVNTLGKIIQYGYIDPNKSYDNPPPLAQKAIIAVEQYGQVPTVAFQIESELSRTSANKTQDIKMINKYFLKGNKGNYVKKSIKKIPTVFVEKRFFYCQPSLKILENKIFKWKFDFVNKIFDSINHFKLAAFLISLVFLVLLLIEKRKEEFMILILLMAAIFYSIAIIATFDVNEPFRSRISVEFLLNLLIFTPILYLAILMQRKK